MTATRRALRDEGFESYLRRTDPTLSELLGEAYRQWILDKDREIGAVVISIARGAKGQRR